MSAIRQLVGVASLRSVRGLVAVCMVVIYALSGALHGICNLDVTNPAGKSEVASVLGGKSGHSDAGGVTEQHHCHGCFSIMLPLPFLAAALSDHAMLIAPHRPVLIAGGIAAPDSPPPKHLI